MADNKMEQVAALCGFEVIGAENPYVDIDAYVLFDLLAGYAEVDDD